MIARDGSMSRGVRVRPAFASTLNPKLLAVDLLLIENRRPRAMFLCFCSAA